MSSLIETSSPAASSKADVPTFSGAVGFTPGPWKAQEDEWGDFTISGAAEPLAIAAVVNGTVRRLTHDSAQHKANAHLITASPALYRACELALTRLDDGTEVSAKIAEHVRAALKQARGE